MLEDKRFCAGATPVALTMALALGCIAPEEAPVESSDEPVVTAVQAADHLFVWAGDKDEKDSDFLAVIDARRSEPSYGRVVATLPVGATGTMPHHTEYEFPPDGLLFAGGWLAGQSFVMDLSEPRMPRLVAEFTGAGGYSFPHSYARLPDGHRLTTFQGHEGRYGPPGGLVEIDATGAAVRSSRAEDASAGAAIWPYSLTVLPDIDRAIVTSTEMGMPPWEEYEDTFHVQVWSLSDLRLRATVPLPESGKGPHHLYPAEARRLADGSVMVNTFSCGLYRILEIEGDSPRAELVHLFPGDGTILEKECGGPVVVGRYWIQTVAALPALIALDVSEPSAPVEVARLMLEPPFVMPHWIAADRTADRLVVTGGDGSWVLVVDIDRDSGALMIDERFREPGAERPGIRFDRDNWPHGGTGPAIVHGALFGG